MSLPLFLQVTYSQLDGRCRLACSICAVRWWLPRDQQRSSVQSMGSGVFIRISVSVEALAFSVSDFCWSILVSPSCAMFSFFSCLSVSQYQVVLFHADTIQVWLHQLVEFQFYFTFSSSRRVQELFFYNDFLDCKPRCRAAEHYTIRD